MAAARIGDRALTDRIVAIWPTALRPRLHPYNALHVAARHGTREACQALLDAEISHNTRMYCQNGEDSNLAAMNAQAPIKIAAARGDAAILRTLLDAGADPDYSPLDLPSTPIHAAAGNGHIEAPRAVIQAGAVNRLFDGHRADLLQAASVEGGEAMCRKTLDPGADLAAEDSGGETPLHAAATGGRNSICRMRMAAGANPDAASETGATPRTLTEASSRMSMLAILNPPTTLQPEHPPKEGETP